LEGKEKNEEGKEGRGIEREKEMVVE